MTSRFYKCTEKEQGICPAIGQILQSEVPSSAAANNMQNLNMTIYMNILLYLELHYLYSFRRSEAFLISA